MSMKEKDRVLLSNQLRRLSLALAITSTMLMSACGGGSPSTAVTAATPAPTPAPAPAPAPEPSSFTKQEVKQVDFGAGANHFTIKAASEGSGGEIELRLDSAKGPVIGRAFMHHTGSPLYFLDYETKLSYQQSRRYILS
jgi:Carbohydrate binding module (family 6)